MPIYVLSPSVAAKIAAGEVIERPAAVVKELVENSLDAGATVVTVEVAGGGTRLIRVVDNGGGIPADEVRLAFQRHATSKLASLEDLERIQTLGFRGEALPSIAAVAQVTLVSRPPQALAAAYVILREGEMAEEGRRGAPPGTTVTVRNLFQNLPARLKFLKSTGTELGHIHHLLTHFTLAFPGVRVTLLSEGKTLFQSPGSGAIADALAATYGAETAAALLPVGTANEEPGTGLEVSGFVSPPTLSRARSGISLFVNGRWVQSRTLTYAVEEACSGLLVKGKHPIAIIFLGLPPGEVDVNVHPTKREVRFRREGEVFAAVQKAVRETILRGAPLPTLRHWSPPRLTPAETAAVRLFAPPPPGHQAPMVEAPPEAKEAPGLPLLRVVGQLATTYIVAEGPDGMYLIDQHTAHERILYDKFLAELRDGQVEVQGLLEPQLVELALRERELVAEQSHLLSQLGFALEPFGEGSYLLRAVPALLRDREAGASLRQLLADLEESSASADFRDRAAASLACHAAVRAGQVLSPEEIRNLVRQLEAASLPRTCPHGRPILLHMSVAQLEREFGRR